jgi:CheY-like chemotaxis protein
MSSVISPYSEAPQFRVDPGNFPKHSGMRGSVIEYEICMTNHGMNTDSQGRSNTMARILVVDDENLIVYSLSVALRNDGSQVTAVTNGKDALSEIQRSLFDICFLDIHLPDANGFDLMKIVREISPATRIILMTAIDLDDAQMNDLRHHNGHYLPKPFDLEEVRSIVKGIKAGSASTVRDA